MAKGDWSWQSLVGWAVARRGKILLSTCGVVNGLPPVGDASVRLFLLMSRRSRGESSPCGPPTPI